MKDKKGFILYADQQSIFKKLPDEKAGQLIKLIYEYVNDTNPTPKDLVLDIAFEPIKQQLKRDGKLWEERKQKRVEAGRKGGLAKSNNHKQNVAMLSNAKKGIANVAVSVNDNVNDKVIDIRRDKFIKDIEYYKNNYPAEILNQFYLYWSELTHNKKSMRFEMEKTFEIGRRLSSWFRRSDYKAESNQNGLNGFKHIENIKKQLEDDTRKE